LKVRFTPSARTAFLENVLTLEIVTLLRRLATSLAAVAALGLALSSLTTVFKGSTVLL
jgi:hypothetical protein